MSSSKSRVVYPGTFDPFTYGHEDIVEQASHIFDHITVAVAAQSTHKKTMFTLSERIEMITKIVRKYKNVDVVGFDGLLVRFMKESGFSTVLRGLRVISDFEYEFQMASMNRKMDKGYTSLFLLPSDKNLFVSSTAVREISAFGGNVDQFVDPCVADMLQLKTNC
ncbi:MULTISPECIES: pantetheine-phosphate adenylyltransferase [Candidatus Ichthyocystis]|uniref:pantetheine-phosphate adenylyltransferase n=1 Tax=Candidatus Ichthyocystis TaxID=2929841 RepID=UPI000B8901E2|nr:MULTISPECIES: pantetheine-phosphate adenylyltransferase [Ichthyocystis]